MGGGSIIFSHCADRTATATESWNAIEVIFRVLKNEEATLTKRLILRLTLLHTFRNLTLKCPKNQLFCKKNSHISNSKVLSKQIFGPKLDFLNSVIDEHFLLIFISWVFLIERLEPRKNWFIPDAWYDKYPTYVLNKHT